MKYIFLIATEHQLFQVKEAQKHFSLSKENSILLVMNVGAVSGFIERAKNNISFGEVHVFDTWIFKDLILKRKNSQKFIEFCKALNQKNQNYTFFYSQYKSDPDLLFLSIVKPQKYYLMDEGTASFGVVKKRTEGNILPDKLKMALKSLLYRQSISYPKVVTYFTKYFLKIKKGDCIELYKVEKKNNQLKKLKKKEAAFLGSSIAEIGMIEEHFYLSYLTSVFNDNKTCEKFYYHPHRKETAKKLKLIEEIGFLVKKIDIPFETFFESQEKMPQLICSFFTTGVLDNISKSNINLPHLRVYKFNTEKLIFSKSIYKAIYAEMLGNENLEFREI